MMLPTPSDRLVAPPTTTTLALAPAIAFALSLCLALLAATPAAAQTPPEADPQLTDPSWRQPVADPSLPTSAEPDDTASATAPDYRIRRAPLLPEGSFLPRRRGTLVRSGSGEWVYVFHPDEQGVAEPPMTLLPGATLERMEEVLGRRSERPQFILTGQVFVYRGANYLLPTAFSVAPPLRAEPEATEGETGEAEVDPAADADAGPEATQPAIGDPVAPPAARPSDLDAAVDDLIERIESERPGARALGESSMLADITRAGGAGAPGADTGVRPRPDGALLVRRRGRLTRQASAWRLTFDNDTDAPSEFQTSMVLLPCLNLERMEALAADRGENQSFEVSGMVMQYRGRNFLVPTIYRVTLAGGVRPLQ